MSKSLKNFVSIKDALSDFTPRQLRLMFLLQPWNGPMVYGEAARGEMRSRETGLRNFFGKCAEAERAAAAAEGSAAQKTDAESVSAGVAAIPPTRWGAAERDLHSATSTCLGRVHAALCDSFDTRGALDAVAELAVSTARYLTAAREPPAIPCPRLVRSAAGAATRVLSALGLVDGGGPSDRPGLDGAGAGDSGAEDSAAAYDRLMDCFSGFRDDVRSAARGANPMSDVLAACDAVRDEGLAALGVRLEDDPAAGKGRWRREDPAALARERAEREAEAARARTSKLQGQLKTKRAELDKLTALAALPSVEQALADRFCPNTWESPPPPPAAPGRAASSEPGPPGPTRAADGTELDPKARKAAGKAAEKERKQRAPLEKALQKGGEGALQALAADVEALEAALEAL